ncbi:MAG: RraA family protein [Desulfitobacterium hafniense]|nr:RraA family protein [Desulfitobacterium hafniense]
MSTLSKEYRERLEKLSTTNISDALDKLDIRGTALGIRPLWGAPKIIGTAVTIKMTAAGQTKSQYHLGSAAIDSASEGDIILVDNGGRTDVSVWGGILATGAKKKGIVGVIADGACRDADEYLAMNYPVFARAAVPLTARGRVIQESYNTMIQIGGVQVRPGDVVMADANGVVVIPVEKLDEVLADAELVLEKELQMMADIENGLSMMEVDQKYRYETMLK